MAFCTNCGASVSGAFCNQCGAPARAAGQGMTPPPPMPSTAAPAPAPTARRMSPLVIILIVIGGLFALGLVAVIGTGMFFVHKAREAGLSPELMSRNPGYAAAKMVLALNKDLTEVSHDDNTGTITVRDNKTGQESTLSFDDIKHGKFRITARDEQGKTATMEFGAGANLSKLPSWVPEYPGSTSQGTFSIRGDSGDLSEGGTFAFNTKDSPSKVMDFYQSKAKDLGMKISMNTTTPQGGMVVAADENENRSLSIIVGEGSGDTTVSVTYGRKR
jgi:hypothetical protein